MKTLPCVMLICLAGYLGGVQAMEQKAILHDYSKLPNDLINEILPYLFDPYTHSFGITAFITHAPSNEMVEHAYNHVFKEHATYCNLQGLFRFAQTCKKANLLTQEYLKKFELKSPEDVLNLKYNYLHSNYCEKIRPLIFKSFPKLNSVVDKRPETTVAWDKGHKNAIRLGTRKILIDIIKNDCTVETDNKDDVIPTSDFYLSHEGVLFSVMLILKFMKEHTYDINEDFADLSEFPLVVACKQKEIPLIKLLLYAGANTDIKIPVQYDTPGFPTGNYTLLDYLKNEVGMVRWDPEKFAIIQKIIEDHNKKAEQKEKKEQKCLIS